MSQIVRIGHEPDPSGREMNILELIILKLFVLLFSFPAQVSTAEEVIDRYLNAMGGQEAIDAIQTLTYTRELEHEEENRINRNVYCQKRPHPRDAHILSRIGPFLDYEKRGIRIELIDTIAIEGADYHHLEMTYPAGHRTELFFDVETGLFSMFKPNPETTVRLYDYRRVGDVLIPHKTEGKGTLPDGRNWHHVNTLVDVELNSSIDDSFFEPDLP